MELPSSLFRTGQRVRLILSGTTGTIKVTHTLIPGYYDVHLDGATTRRVVFETDIEAIDADKDEAGSRARASSPACL